MFDNLSDKLNNTLKKLKGHGKLSEKNIQDALREVRINFLEADVNFKVVKQFISSVKERAMGAEVMQSLSPGQQFVKIVNQELTNIMGERSSELNLKAKPPVSLMMVGLQGSGKTTSAGKIALYLKKQGRTPMLVPADVYRPAAIEQLKVLAKQVDVPVYNSTPDQNPVDICKLAKEQAEKENIDTILIDTAGRLHIDEPLMDELSNIKNAVSPMEILLVADAMTGQDAVNVAEKFNELLDITGVVLTKLDGDARGGAALSIKAVTGKPIKFVGVGEKLTELDVFHPDRMASRILDMGDMMSLIEKAQETYDAKKAQEMEKKLRKNQFTLNDFLDSLQQMKKLGPLDQLMKMIPGMGKMMKKMKHMQPPEKELKRIEAIINSMTKKERNDHTLLNGSRRRRISKGSGTTVQQVNQFIKQYLEARKMMRKLTKSGLKGMMKGLPGQFPGQF